MGNKIRAFMQTRKAAVIAIVFFSYGVGSVIVDFVFPVLRWIYEGITAMNTKEKVILLLISILALLLIISVKQLERTRTR